MNSLLLRLANQLPAPARQLATAARVALLVQFLMFGMVGTIGFLVDTGVVYALRHRLGLYGAGVAAYLVAASVTWALNRIWTFRGHVRSAPHHQQWIGQWVRFLIANLGGFVLNRGTYALLVTFVPLCAEQPVFAVAAGVIPAMFLNFGLSRRLVFR
jgi:putative flippase GtrA